MALHNLLWIKDINQVETAETHQFSCRHIENDPEYHKWPYTIFPVNPFLSNNLDRYLQENDNANCEVDVFFGAPESEVYAPLWEFHRKIESASSLLNLLQMDKVFVYPHRIYSESPKIILKPQGAEKNSTTKCTFYLVLKRSSEVTRMLGYYLRLPPRFFDPSCTIQAISPKCDMKYMYFKLRLMDKFPSDPLTPTERKGHDFSVNFLDEKHEWRDMQLSFICIASPESTHFNAVCVLDPANKTIADVLGTLFVLRNDELMRLPTMTTFDALFQLINEIFRVLGLTWGTFLSEAEEHLQRIVRPKNQNLVISNTSNLKSDKCVRRSELQTNDQLKFTQELHRLTPQWGQISWRLSAMRDVIKSILEHPFFSDYVAQERSAQYLLNVSSTVDQHRERTKALVEDTKTLISLV
ncbi:hypothetical protein AOQ84DRAFT_379078 [Glonium stellatum]|uniref:Uncharacterized protein n=1 Tax=Glonium stellatum TaxID=574774 RepID=A0A8E2EW40_9PEZI|nr:hypothetical protein AOQ84DRAFT_379078 [Glonium stellatum]